MTSLPRISYLCVALAISRGCNLAAAMITSHITGGGNPDRPDRRSFLAPIALTTYNLDAPQPNIQTVQEEDMSAKIAVLAPNQDQIRDFEVIAHGWGGDKVG